MYDRLTPISYNLGSVDFASGADSTISIPLPPGVKMARVLDVILQVTEVFTAVTTPAKVLVGVAADPDSMVSMTIATPAAGTLVNLRTYPGSNLAVYNAGGTMGTVTALLVSLIDTTGGTLTGTADVTVVIGYDQIEDVA